MLFISLRNAQVGGSIPPLGSSKINVLHMILIRKNGLIFNSAVIYRVYSPQVSDKLLKFAKNEFRSVKTILDDVIQQFGTMTDDNDLNNFSFKPIDNSVILINPLPYIFISIFLYNSSGFVKLGNRFNDDIRLLCKKGCVMFGIFSYIVADIFKVRCSPGRPSYFVSHRDIRF